MPGQVLLDTGLRPQERLALIMIYAHSEPDGFADIGTRKLANSIGQSQHTLRRHIRSLEEANYIQRHWPRPPNGKTSPTRRQTNATIEGFRLALAPSGTVHKWAEGLDIGTSEWVNRPSRME